jgi:hypothetical protein
MDKLEAYLKAAEVAAGGVYTKIAGTYQEVGAFTSAHPEVQVGVTVATGLLKAAGIDVTPEISMAELVWGKLGVLLAVDPTVKGPTIAPATPATTSAGA